MGLKTVCYRGNQLGNRVPREIRNSPTFSIFGIVMSVQLVSAVIMLLILDLCEEQTSAVIFSYGHMGGDIYLCRYVMYISILSLLISSQQVYIVECSMWIIF